MFATTSMQKILIYNLALRLNVIRFSPILLVFFALSFSTALFAKSYHIDKVQFIGLERSQESWIKEYLNLSCPFTLTETDILNMEEKLLTSQVFLEAKVYPKVSQSKRLDLVVQVEEKWTTIPVVRGAFGGGTPLLVAGVYDTHSFGKLWTLGGEFRKYGDAPTGGVVWARAPRWLNGNYYLNFELWQDNRLRSLYKKEDGFKEIAEIDSRAKMLNFSIRIPSGIDKLNLGLQLSSRTQEPTRVSFPDSSVDFDISSLKLNTGDNTLNKALLNIVYDEISINKLHYNGHRITLNLGPIFYEGKVTRLYELEYFYYKFFANKWNFAFHSFIGSASDSSLQNQKFLGGFDSVRGLPDGALYGRNAAYSNIELRYLSFKHQKMWIQSVLFADGGFAENQDFSLRETWTKSAGIGFRFAVPQINRMMFRIDYAWSLDGSGTQGITAGMNQFFQPYKPL